MLMRRCLYGRSLSINAAIALTALASPALIPACSAPEPRAGSELETATQSALSDDQCEFFDVNGDVQICHHTSSVAHPFTVIRTSVQGCINGHSAHSLDYVAVGDPTCQGGGCLPATAPCDDTLPCCDGLTCHNGTCVDICTVTPPDTTSDLDHQWTFDESSGSTAVDSAGTSNGILGSSAQRWPSFDGSGAIALNPNAACDLQAEVSFGNAPGAFGTADFTVAYWVATNFSGAGLG